MFHRRKAALIGFLLILMLAVQPAAAAGSTTGSSSGSSFAAAAAAFECVSTGSEGYGGGSYAALSADGRYVVFESFAADLASGHVRDSWDVFLRDRFGSEVERVSTRSGGDPVYNPGDYTSSPAISASGRYVAFMSRSESLVDNDGNGLPDIFLHDRQANTTRLVSVNQNGASGNGQSFTPAISPDGRYVAFQSLSNDLAAGDTNDAMDIFVRDMQSGVTELISITSSGVQGFDESEYGFSSLSISEGGRLVAFSYQYLPMPGQPPAFYPSVYIRDRQAQTTRAVAVGEYPRLSSDGRFLVFISPDRLTADDDNIDPDVYLFELQTGRLERVSLPAAGSSPDMQTFSGAPDVSSNGRFVVFVASGGLTPGAPAETFQVYLRDRSAGTTTLISQGFDGSPANEDAHSAAIAASGSTLAFTSSASNLMPDDENQTSDVFVVDLSAQAIVPGRVWNIFFLPIMAR